MSHDTGPAAGRLTVFPAGAPRRRHPTIARRATTAVRAAVTKLFAVALAALPVLVAAVVPAEPAAAQSNTLWVSTTGVPAPPGTSCDNPGFDNVADAVAAAAPGDEIILCPGEHFHGTNQVYIGKPVTIRGFGPEQTILRPAFGTPTASRTNPAAGFIRVADTASGTVLTGFTIDGGDQSIGEAIRAEADVTVTNMVFRNIRFGSSSGIAIAARAKAASRSQLTVDNVTFSNIGRVGVDLTGDGGSASDASSATRPTSARATAPGSTSSSRSDAEPSGWSSKATRSAGTGAPPPTVRPRPPSR